MGSAGREGSTRWALLALTLLLALGLAASSPAHKGLHDDHAGDDCAACELAIAHGPGVAVVPGPPIEARPAAIRIPSEPERAAADELHAPRGPPASRS